MPCISCANTENIHLGAVAPVLFCRKGSVLIPNRKKGTHLTRHLLLTFTKKGGAFPPLPSGD